MIMILILKPHRYSVALITPELLHQFVLQLFLPLSGQESSDSVPTLKELVPISPFGVCRSESAIGAATLNG